MITSVGGVLWWGHMGMEHIQTHMLHNEQICINYRAVSFER